MSINNLDHHKMYEYCKTRPKYRQGKALTAVKVYTVVNESKHLYVFGVPKINLQNEIKREFQKFGQITFIKMITDDIAKKTKNTEFELEAFTDCFHICFEKLERARKAKKFIDKKNFYGGILHVSYAPEHETIDELRQKLQQRKKEVDYRIKINQKNALKKRSATTIESNSVNKMSKQR